MFSIDNFIEGRLPGVSEKKPVWYKPLLVFLRYLCHEREFRQFQETYPHIEGFDFVEQVLRKFQFGYRVMDYQQECIPAYGRVVIVANHPIGSLDGLALLKLIGSVRRDVKVVANELLYSLEPLRTLLLPVDNMGHSSTKQQVQAIRDHLDQEGAIIIFPAGEVSRFSATGIKDGRWNSGFLRFASNTNAPILPVYVDGRNSIFFYALSMLAKPISTLWLIREMFKHARHHVDISIGSLILPEQYELRGISAKKKSKLFKKHVYSLGKKKVKHFSENPQEAIAHPESRHHLRMEIQSCERLGTTPDGKHIYLYQYQSNSFLMREIGRLRELTFRAVKEGTGRRRDIDQYDRYYDQLLLWDDEEMELVGAYRMAPSKRVIESGQSLYTESLFKFKKDLAPYLDKGLELGRSFVQPRYWGKRSLDYLWYGIGAYLLRHPDIRYLFGPVTMSNDYPNDCKDLMIYFYSHYFAAKSELVEARLPYCISAVQQQRIASLLGSGNYQSQFTQLKHLLSSLGYSVPTLYKQYTELCEEGGVQFCDFNIDPDFSHCVDGFILVDIEKIKAKKFNRYVTVHADKKD